MEIAENIVPPVKFSETSNNKVAVREIVVSRDWFSNKATKLNSCFKEIFYKSKLYLIKNPNKIRKAV